MSKPYYIGEDGEVYLSMPAIMEIIEVSEKILDDMSDNPNMIPGVETGARITLNHLANTFVRVGMLSARAGVLDKEMESSTEELIEGIYDYLKEQ